ncbi:MAG: Na(+)-transporting NADH-quinone reductase subunit B [Chlamydiia bacterium]|nr:Na(+)-transporting NADH-quinone reductase subunit B [Chlamydiia bacterium]
MLRRFFDFQLSLTEPGKPLAKLRPLITAADTFFYEAPINTSRGPHIRDAVDIKRWMVLVVVALLPALLVGIWNTGLQSYVYSSGNWRLMDEYLATKGSLANYFAFAGKDNRFLSIFWEGLTIVMPRMILIYAVGGLVEGIFAVIRGHEISEGFLVTGILFALILPPTIPYWMAAVGVTVGIVLAKEIFGGSGMNIVNPALACRCFLFFAYPGRMSGNVWVGSNPTVVRESLLKMNQEAGKGALDGYTQATLLNKFNVSQEIKRIHVDAIASNNLGDQVGTWDTLQNTFSQWNQSGDGALGELTQEQMRNFVTSPVLEGGLGLSPGLYEDAYRFASLNYGLGEYQDMSFFLGDRLGCMGETSVLANLLGAAFLIWVGIGSWRTMVAMGLGAFLTASLFNLGANFFGADGGAWNAAQFAFPAYKHLLIGGLSFGLVFMATDPVSSPDMKGAKWIYGIFCGVVTLVIRAINPAYPEGVMLAILMGNVFSPLFDYYAAKRYRKKRLIHVS